MTPVLVSVDKAGDLKIGRKKCRLYKKDEVVKVAKKYGINTDKKTVQQLCGSIKNRAKNANTNNIPLAKLYPEAAKKRMAAKKRAEKKAQPLTKGEAIKLIKAMNGLSKAAKNRLVSRVHMETMSPPAVVKVARELSKMKGPLIIL